MIDIFDRATKQVCQISFETTIEMKDSLLIGSETPFLGSITATMKLTGDVRGWAAVSLDENLARRLTARLAWCKPDEVAPEDLADGVGEIINQISGLAKTMLSQQGQDMGITLPECKSGSQMKVDQSDQPSMTMIYECLGNCFAVQLSIEARQLVSADVAD